MVKAIDINEIGEALNDKADLDWNNCEIPPITENQISNCLLETPQLVNLELNDGVLTLKAGSVVIVPSGISAPDKAIGDALNGGIISDISWDGSKLFYYVKISSDKQLQKQDGFNQSYNCMAIIFNTVDDIFPYKRIFSGDTAPTVSGNTNVWYDTLENQIKYTDTAGSEWKLFNGSFPVANITVNSGVISNIDQIFQSIGYIGSTFWCGKGVKGLIPNGRNPDGSLRNIERTSQTVITKNTSYKNYNDIAVITNLSNVVEPTTWIYNANSFDETSITTQFARYYNYETNYVRFRGSSAIWINQTGYMLLANKINTDANAKILSMNIPTAYKSVDYFDFQTADKDNVKLIGNQTIVGAKTFSGSIYSTAESNGAIRGITNDGIVKGGLFFVGSGDNNQCILQVSKYDGSFGHNFNFAYNSGVPNLNLGYSPLNTDNSNKATTTSWVRNHTFAPSSKYIDLTFGANGSTYTAPADGYYTLQKSSGVSTAGHLGLVIRNGTTEIYKTIINSIDASSGLSIFAPVKKGDNAVLIYSHSTGTVQLFRFIYAEIDSY